MSILRRAIIVVCSSLLVVSFTACKKEGPAERAGKKIDETVEKTEKKIKDTAEKAGDKIEEAGKKVKESTQK